MFRLIPLLIYPVSAKIWTVDLKIRNEPHRASPIYVMPEYSHIQKTPPSSETLYISRFNAPLASLDSSRVQIFAGLPKFIVEGRILLPFIFAELQFFDS